YLQTGNCGLNGEGCTTVELTLKNPNCPGCGSSVDISMIPPLAWNGVSTGFGYYGGCDGAGANCNGPNCNTAFHGSNDNWVQVQCENNDLYASEKDEEEQNRDWRRLEEITLGTQGY
ncbi:hypothetical protein BDN72DRAFT_861842, partial [Pluteus cervinus]